MIEFRYSASARVDPFGLYAAISRIVPFVHGAGLAIAQRDGAVIVRAEAAPFERAELDVRGRRCVLSLRSSSPIVGASSLRAELVVIKLTRFDHSVARSQFAAEATRQLEALGGGAVNVGAPGSVRVHGRLVEGYAVHVACAPGVGLALQTQGIGGKRSMGCGVFFPC